MVDKGEITDREKYQKYDFAVIATDVVIFTIKDGKLQVLLIQMKKEPFEDMWAFPGGLVEPTESVEEAAQRHLEEKAGVTNVYLEQLYTFGEVERDPFGRVVSVAYFALIPSDEHKVKTLGEYDNIAWFPARNTPPLAYDHDNILAVSISRLKSKLGYTNIVYSLLPDKFTFSDLRHVYEIIMGRELDKRNFRRKIESLDIIEKVPGKKRRGPHRPAQLYRFQKQEPQIVEIL